MVYDQIQGDDFEPDYIWYEITEPDTDVCESEEMDPDDWGFDGDIWSLPADVIEDIVGAEPRACW